MPIHMLKQDLSKFLPPQQEKQKTFYQIDTVLSSEFGVFTTMSFGVDFGQKVDLTASIRNILRNYPEGTSILKVSII
jgi:hypothetical protein